MWFFLECLIILYTLKQETSVDFWCGHTVISEWRTLLLPFTVKHILSLSIFLFWEGKRSFHLKKSLSTVTNLSLLYTSFFSSQPSPLYFSVFTPTWTSATPEGEVRVSRELNLTLGGLCFSSVCKGIFRLAVSEKPDRPHNVWGWVSISCEVESMRLKYIKASSPGTWVLILFQPLTNYLPLEGDLTFLGLSFLFGNLI